MKLLLTSAGFTNDTIIKALQEIVRKPFDQVSLAFVPTAANVEDGDKSWLIEDLVDLKGLHLTSVDIVDISALPKGVWFKRLSAADIIMVGGGNTFHLQYQVAHSGLENVLPELLQSRVYVGISAGSMLVGNRLSLDAQHAERTFAEHIGEKTTNEGLGFVDFCLEPHLNSPYFPETTVIWAERLAKDVTETVYLIDDNTAIKVVDGKVGVVSEGIWKKFN